MKITSLIKKLILLVVLIIEPLLLSAQTFKCVKLDFLIEYDRTTNLSYNKGKYLGSTAQLYFYQDDVLVETTDNRGDKNSESLHKVNGTTYMITETKCGVTRSASLKLYKTANYINGFTVEIKDPERKRHRKFIYKRISRL